jgi:predicted Ser/Thr protein kinase
MGEVYRARDTRLDRIVALKILNATVAGDPQLRDRFEREARTLSKIDHPHICALYDIGTDAGTSFIVMQYLEGETLSARLAKGALPVEQALRIAIEICGALDTAHRHGIVHRDLKPANIMLTKTGARLLDFGIARQARVLSGAGDAAMTQAAEGVTGKGTLLGTIHYMAPEQLKGHEADARSDIFSLGVVMYEMVSGRRPFDAGDTATLIAAILDRAPRPIGGQATLPRRLERAIETAVEKDPEDRWQSARDLSRELQWIAEDRLQTGAVPQPVAAPPPSRRKWLLRVAIVLALAVIPGALFLFYRTPGTGSSHATPVIILMDSPHPERVYDPATLKAGGTNADDLTELLQDLPAVFAKETTGTSWRREEQVLGENPAVIVAHRSCFYDATLLPEHELNSKYFELLVQPPWDKFEAFLGYVALGNPRTRFIVYSRGSWSSEEAKNAWVGAMERRFPRLKGRLTAYKVPLDRATFRNPETGTEIKALVSSALASIAKAEATR